MSYGYKATAVRAMDGLHLAMPATSEGYVDVEPEPEEEAELLALEDHVSNIGWSDVVSTDGSDTLEKALLAALNATARALYSRENRWPAVELRVAPLTIETPTMPTRGPSSGVLFADRSRRAVTDWLPPGRGP